MSDTVTLKWSTVGIIGAVLVGGYVMGRMAVPDPAPQAAAPPAAKAPAPAKAADTKTDEAPPADEKDAESRKPKRKKKTKKKRGKGVTYDGKEWERVKETDEFGDIDKMMLKLRQKQPIHYLGVPMRQIPTDNWLMSELLFEIKPDFIIEAGTLWGGSALYYSAHLEQVNPKAKIISVDINEEQIKEEARSHPLWKKRVTFIKGSSTAPEVIEQIKKKVGEGKKAFVTLDTLHAPKHVAKELELYSQFVSVGSYMILQDTYYEGLQEVLDDFLKKNPGWVRDKKLDKRYIFTKYGGGFLKRVK